MSQTKRNKQSLQGLLKMGAVVVLSGVLTVAELVGIGYLGFAPTVRGFNETNIIWVTFLANFIIVAVISRKARFPHEKVSADT